MAQKAAEIDARHHLYHEKLKLEATAKYWQDMGGATSKRAKLALAGFILAVAAPLIVIAWQWSSFVNTLNTLFPAGGGLSLTPIVAVTVPVLGYGWFLRHISRLFIQNMALADDASYRRVMTMTFLGLQYDEKAKVSEAERALILNALFRPAPPNATEDGPPSGLLDLIKR